MAKKGDISFLEVNIEHTLEEVAMNVQQLSECAVMFYFTDCTLLLPVFCSWAFKLWNVITDGRLYRLSSLAGTSV